jgi:hypothetical protein
VLGIWETIENSGPAGRWLIERVGRVTTNLELSALTGGRVMHYAIPEQLKDDYAVKRLGAAAARWTPPQ